MSSNQSCDRTALDVLYSCSATVFACTWASVHPNIQHQERSSFRKGLSRVLLMILALLVPEIFVMWAARDWISARRIVKDTRNLDGKWTNVYAFFVVMGGFVKEDKTLRPEDFYSADEEYEFPIKEEEILDKSKADGIAKGLALVQIGWFGLQCIARLAQGWGTITAIELATLGFGVLTLFTYLLWWNKPLNVACAVRLKRKSTQSLRRQDSLDSMESHHPRAIDWIWRCIVGHVREAQSLLSAHAKDKRWQFALLRFMSHFLQPFTQLLGAEVPNYSYSDLISGLNPDPRDDTWHACMVLAVLGLAAVFGSIHCIGWSLSFPSYTEKILWRASSLTITIIPVIVGIVFISGAILDARFGINLITGQGQATGWIGRVNILVSSFFLPTLYGYARVLLLILPLLYLRSLPLEACQNVHWSTFIPHI
ncbi:hypothetical protein DFH09DRAFT_1023006 [Mycena vulgaris]|nr:hypothetical protein DFH09DRAFT_1023006 [Mycena vulgaris]